MGLTGPLQAAVLGLWPTCSGQQHQEHCGGAGLRRWLPELTHGLLGSGWAGSTQQVQLSPYLPPVVAECMCTPNSGLKSQFPADGLEVGSLGGDEVMGGR